MKFAISITETLSKIAIVEAKAEYEAVSIVEDLWKEGHLILDADNFQGVEYEHEPDFIIDDDEETIN